MKCVTSFLPLSRLLIFVWEVGTWKSCLWLQSFQCAIQLVGECDAASLDVVACGGTDSSVGVVRRDGDGDGDDKAKDDWVKE